MKLYLVVREDLPLGQQAVQAAHALRQFVAEHPAVDLKWYRESNTLALLAIPDEPSLDRLARKAKKQGVAVACFREPDRQDQLTAIAMGPDGKALTRRLPLAMQTV